MVGFSPTRCMPCPAHGKENPPGEGGFSPATKEGSLDHLIIIKVERGKTSCPEGIFCWSYPLDDFIIRKNYGKSMALTCELHQIFHIRISRIESEFSDNCSSTILTAFLNEKNRKRESCGFSWEKGNGGFPFVLIMNREDQV